jgi:hypothetical protein
MPSRPVFLSSWLVIGLVMGVSGCWSSQASAAPPTIPDLTAGGERTPGTADFNLGPTGARGWVWGRRCGSYDSRQILVTEVAEDSPTAGVLEVGDVILGINGQPFTEDARRGFGRAIGKAEETGKLPLLVWRDGQQTHITLTLKVLGAYSDTWPYDCEKSRQILAQGCEWVAQTELKGIPGDVNALALLASGHPKYLPIVKQYARSIAPPDFELDFTRRGGHISWGFGYRAIFLSEYYLATGDDHVLPALRQYAHETARMQSAVGTWGHRGADLDINQGQTHGRLGGYGAVNAAGLPCFVGMILARKCGIDDDLEINDAIERSRRFFAFFANRGSIPYGFHPPRLSEHDDNGKNCMGAIAFDLLETDGHTRHFSRWALASYDSRELGHTGNFFGYLWGPPGVARIGPTALNAFMKEQQWYYDLARDHRGRFHYQGQAGAGRQNYSGWDCTGVYLMAYALPLQKTYFSGRGVREANTLDVQAVAESIEAGRGYTSWDQGHAYYSAMSESELLKTLCSWSAMTRHRAAKALAEKPGDHTPQFIELLQSDDSNAKYGACQAIQRIGAPCEGAVDALIELLDEPDPWLRVNAAQALAAIGGDRARKAVPKLLELLAGEDAADTLMVESRFVGEAVFSRRGAGGKPGLLAESIDGVDKQELLVLARRILRHPNGRARGHITSLYKLLTPQDLKPIMPDIIASIERPAWSVMFSNGVREDGLAYLAEHHIAEGLTQLMKIMDPDSPRGNEGYWFAPRVVKYLEHYRGAAKPYLSKLKENAARYRTNRMLEKNERFHKQMQETIELIENDNDPPMLIRWKDL